MSRTITQETADWCRLVKKRYHRSFHIWSAYSLLQSFEQIARDWLAAQGDPPREQTFFNDVVGRAYRTLGEAPPWEEIRDRAAESEYLAGTIPEGYPLVTCGVDCQGDRVEWQVVAWGRNKRRAIIHYGVIDGHISEEKCQQGLNSLLKQRFTNSYGRKLEIDMLAIDGNAYTEDVWEWSRKHSSARVIMVRGVPSENAALLVKVKKERNSQGKFLKYSRRFFNFATSILKMGLYRNIRKDDAEERGYVALPKGLEDEFYRQLTAETRKGVKSKTTGFKRYIWVKDPNQANEGLDTHLQAEAAAVRLGVRQMLDPQWDKIFAERECPPEDLQSDFDDLLSPIPKVVTTEPEKTADVPKKDPRSKWSNRS